MTEGPPTTTDDHRDENFRDRVARIPDADLLREMIGLATERLMALKAGAVTGTAHGVKAPARRAQRNGDRNRDRETRAGTVGLQIPKLRKAAISPASSSRAAWPGGC